MAKFPMMTTTTVPSLLAIGTMVTFDNIYSKRREGFHKNELYRFKKTDMDHVHLQEFGAAPEPVAWTGAVSYESPNEGYTKTLTPDHYNRGFQISRQLKLVDQTGIASDRAASYADAFARYEEQSAINLFNNSFTTELAGDGLPLCDTVHTTKVDSTTFSNEGTLQFNRANVWTVYNTARLIKNDRNQVRVGVFDELLLPMAKQEMGFEINASPNRPHTGDNETNFFKGTFKLLFSPFLTSNFYWWMMDSEMRSQENIWLDLEQMTYETEYDMDTRAYKFAWHRQWTRGSAGFRWLYGSMATS
jgi:hypothetical protein